MITYNHERYIKEAVESALMQEAGFPVELVVGEDCSTDRTREILVELEQRDPNRVRLLLREKNLGANRNFVETLAECRGEYIALLEGDDYWTDSLKLQKQSTFLDGHQDCVFCFHKTADLHMRTGELHARTCQEGLPDKMGLGDILTPSPFHTSSVLFRRSAVPEFPPWYFGLGLGDWPLYMMLARHGDMGFIREVMSVYRVHDASVLTSRSEEASCLARAEMLDHMQRYLGRPYRAGIHRSIAREHSRLAEIHESQGRFPQARAQALKAIGRSLRGYGRPKRSTLGLLLRLTVPWLFRLIQRIRGVRY